MRCHLLVGLILLNLAAELRGDDSAVPPGPAARDPQIVAILKDVSESRMRSRIETLANFGTRHTLSETASDTRGIGAARRWIKAEMDRIAAESGGRLKVEFDSYLQPPTRRVKVATEVVNVMGTLPGTQPGSEARYVVVGGHYDSIRSINEDNTGDAPGANDDASGTAVIMELAQVMSGRSFDATLVFVAFAGEEQGLLGSTHFADEAKKAGKTIEAMITNDIVGNTEGSGGKRDNRTLRVFSEGLPDPKSPLAARLRAVGGENDSPSRQLARYVREAGTTYLDAFQARPVFRSDRYLRGGDHMPFLAQGYPAVRFTEPSEAFERQHQDVRTQDGVEFGDVPARVDYPYVANVCKLNAATLASLALAPPAPLGTTIEARKVENNTSLRWNEVATTDLAGYEVLWRDTTAPFWEKTLYVGKVNQITLPEISKDDVHFGVRAVDRDGHRSLASFPLPGPRN